MAMSQEVLSQKNVLHEIKLMGLEFIGFTNKGQFLKIKINVTKLHQIELQHKLHPSFLYICNQPSPPTLKAIKFIPSHATQETPFENISPPPPPPIILIEQRFTHKPLYPRTTPLERGRNYKFNFLPPSFLN
jgi:hypothetical protein